MCHSGSLLVPWGVAGPHPLSISLHFGALGVLGSTVCGLLTPSFCLPGVFRGGHDLLVRSRLVLTDTVTMQVTARSGEELPVDVIMASVG